MLIFNFIGALNGNVLLPLYHLFILFTELNFYKPFLSIFICIFILKIFSIFQQLYFTNYIPVSQLFFEILHNLKLVVLSTK